MKLDDLLSLPESGVILLWKRGQVLVTYTERMGLYLETLYAQFKGKSDMEIQVRSAGADSETLRLHTEYYRDRYMRSGQLLQFHGRKTICYRIRTAPSPKYTGVDVELVSARGEAKFVGRFKTPKDAKEFIETCYGTDNPFRFPVYAQNSATKEFMLGLQTKMLDIR
jgi:hypothetical protein